MTTFDSILIKKAQDISRWDYREIDILIKIADTNEAKCQLEDIQQLLYDLVLDTI